MEPNDPLPLLVDREPLCLAPNVGEERRAVFDPSQCYERPVFRFASASANTRSISDQGTAFSLPAISRLKVA